VTGKKRHVSLRVSLVYTCGVKDGGESNKILGLGLEDFPSNLHAASRDQKGGTSCFWEKAYQNTVSLRVSQLEDVAASATRQNLLKRMTGNLFQTIVGSKRKARE
jgi:hypothetical protein